MRATIALLLLSLPLFAQTYETGVEAWGADPTLKAASARSVAAASAFDKVLVAWQPLHRQSVYVQLTFSNGNTQGGGGLPVVLSPEPRHLGNVASNGREYVVTYASEGRIWTAFVSGDGRPMALHAAGTTGDIARSSPRLASNGLGYYLTWIDGGRLLGLRLDDFGNNTITTVPRTLLEGSPEVVTIASNGTDYLVLASSGGALYAVSVSVTGEASAPVRVADAIEGAPVLSWDGISFVAFWRDGANVWARAIDPSGTPRDERKPTAPPMTPLAATREFLLLSDGNSLYLTNLGFGGVRLGGPHLLPEEVPGGVATLATGTSRYIVMSLPGLYGVALGQAPVQLAGATSDQRTVDIVRAGNEYVMSWIEEGGELRTSRIVNGGKYVNGHGVVVAQNVTRYAMATNGQEVELAWGDDVQDLVWSGTKFVKITGGTTARAATTRSGYVVVRGNVATAYTPDGAPRSFTTIDGAGELLDVTSDGNARVFVLFRHATAMLGDDAAVIRPLQPLERDATRAGWTGLSFLATRGAEAARFSPQGQLLGTEPLFEVLVPPSEVAVAVGAVGYLRSLSEYHLGDVEHVMFRTLREPTPRRRAKM
ncbi:MAG TPA: hypothetical protein VJ276_06585 [Thermoanaerobaculia bacterium]|nr:hypothetical protein [Thermoanaerobaculia bacterium]